MLIGNYSNEPSNFELQVVQYAVIAISWISSSLCLYGNDLLALPDAEYFGSISLKSTK